MSDAAPAAPAAPAASPGYLGAAPAAAPAAPAAAPATPAAPAAPAASPQTPAAPAAGAATYFFRDDFAKDGKFNEGWSTKLDEMGYKRAASRAGTAKDEAGFWKMVDDAIGHASSKKVTRPTEGASEQDFADYRNLVGAPPKPENYEFKPKDVPKEYVWDEEMGKSVQELAHKHNVPAEFIKELGVSYAGFVQKLGDTGKAKLEGRIGELAAQSEAHFKKEWGDDEPSRRQANLDFINARKFDLNDPIVRAALSHPMIVQVIDEARRATREAPIAGVGKEVFSGSLSPRQQAQEIMKADRNWRNDPAKRARVDELYAISAQQGKRGKR